MNKRKYFGTDGIRGRVGESHINVDFMLRLGYAAGVVLSMQSSGTILIGHDTRASCDMLESALQAGFSAAGLNVVLLGVLPTPAIAYLTHSLRASAGVVISASHNAYHDNGVKFFNSHGMKLADELELAIEAEIDKTLETSVSNHAGHIERLTDAAGRYAEYCKSIFPSQLSLNGLKLVLDCANGATCDVAPNIFRELGADVIAIHNQPNGTNINDHCGATHLESLRLAVKQHHADAGLAFDGDGDRLMMIDEKGEVIDGDEVLCILAKDRSTGLGSRAGVVGTVMSNLGLEQALEKCGVAFERAPVGDRYVLEALIKNGWTLGGEASGHIVDLDYTTTGDGIITALQVLRIMRLSEKSLHDLKQAMIKRPQVLINVPTANTVNLKNYPKINVAVSEMEKTLAGKGRVLLRPSGTEPVVRVMVEGNNEQEVQQAAATLAATVERYISE